MQFEPSKLDRHHGFTLGQVTSDAIGVTSLCYLKDLEINVHTFSKQVHDYSDIVENKQAKVHLPKVGKIGFPFLLRGKHEIFYCSS